MNRDPILYKKKRTGRDSRSFFNQLTQFFYRLVAVQKYRLVENSDQSNDKKPKTNINQTISFIIYTFLRLSLTISLFLRFLPIWLNCLIFLFYLRKIGPLRLINPTDTKFSVNLQRIVSNLPTFVPHFPFFTPIIQTFCQRFRPKHKKKDFYILKIFSNLEKSNHLEKVNDIIEKRPFSTDDKSFTSIYQDCHSVMIKPIKSEHIYFEAFFLTKEDENEFDRCTHVRDYRTETLIVTTDKLNSVKSSDFITNSNKPFENEKVSGSETEIFTQDTVSFKTENIVSKDIGSEDTECSKSEGKDLESIISESKNLEGKKTVSKDTECSKPEDKDIEGLKSEGKDREGLKSEGKDREGLKLESKKSKSIISESKNIESKKSGKTAVIIQHGFNSTSGCKQIRNLAYSIISNDNDTVVFALNNPGIRKRTNRILSNCFTFYIEQLSKYLLTLRNEKNEQMYENINLVGLSMGGVAGSKVMALSGLTTDVFEFYKSKDEKSQELSYDSKSIKTQEQPLRESHDSKSIKTQEKQFYDSKSIKTQEEQSYDFESIKSQEQQSYDSKSIKPQKQQFFDSEDKNHMPDCYCHDLLLFNFLKQKYPEIQEKHLKTFIKQSCQSEYRYFYKKIKITITVSTGMNWDHIFYEFNPVYSKMSDIMFEKIKNIFNFKNIRDKIINIFSYYNGILRNIYDSLTYHKIENIFIMKRIFSLSAVIFNWNLKVQEQIEKNVKVIPFLRRRFIYEPFLLHYYMISAYYRFMKKNKLEKYVLRDLKCDTVGNSKSEPVKSHEVKSQEVKSQEVKSQEVKSQEVKSQEVKSQEVKSQEVKSVKFERCQSFLELNTVIGRYFNLNLKEYHEINSISTFLIFSKQPVIMIGSEDDFLLGLRYKIIEKLKNHVQLLLVPAGGHLGNLDNLWQCYYEKIVNECLKGFSAYEN